MLEMLQRIEKDQEITTHIEATDNINACYYVLADGTMITLGFEDGYRTDDHRAIFSYFKNIEYNDLLQLLKEKIIGFSIELEKLNMIKFQMARINAIQLIDNYIDLKVEDYQDGKIIRNLLNVIYDIYIEERNVNNTGVLSIKKSILSILGEESNLNMDNIDFLEQMSHYITKIRKYAINKKTYNLNSDPRNLIKYNEGDIVSDAILNKINIVSKELHDNILHIKVKSKSGEYNFKFKKA